MQSYSKLPLKIDRFPVNVFLNNRNIFSKSLIYVGFTYLDGNPGVGRTQKYRGVKQNISIQSLMMIESPMAIQM
jgi:hypothetical protein